MWSGTEVCSTCDNQLLNNHNCTNMTTLPTSLRRTLLVLLIAMTTIVMVFYWNQSALKPVTFMNGIFTKVEQNKLVGAVNYTTPLEKTWTYKCVSDKCVREHYIGEHQNSGGGGGNGENGEKRVPFMSCSMICGGPNVWPLPTIKTSLGTQSLSFQSHLMNLDIVTQFGEARTLLQQAYDILLADLRGLENSNKVVGTIADEPTTGGHEQQQQQQLHVDNSARRSSSGGSDREHFVDKDCDIKHVDIKVEISTIKEVYLSMDMDESYELKIATHKSRLSIHIEAKSFFGARNGLATLQQLIWYDDEDDLLRVLNKAHIKDAPKFRYRGLMLDTSRNYFTVDSIKRTLIGMAHSKLNRFHWHITDSQSFPYVSKSYPQLSQYGAYSSKEIYTSEDIREVAGFARVRGIQVLPEIDAPAHAGNGWDWGPKHGLGELSLCINQQPWNFYCGEPPCGQLNPKNNNTYLILQKLYTELLELTGPTDYFHLGGDEVNLECWQQYFNDTDLRGLWCDFLLQAYQRLKIANHNVAPKYVSVWSSGLTSAVCLSHNNWAVQVWGASSWQENFDLISNGFNVVLSHVNAWYLDCGFGSWRTTGSGACGPYSTWHKVYKHRPWEQMHLESFRMKQILGGEACLWTEQIDENILDARLWPRASALGERLWSDPPDDRDMESVSKETFTRMSIFRNRLVQFGLKAEPLFPKYCAQNQDECA